MAVREKAIRLRNAADRRPEVPSSKLPPGAGLRKFNPLVVRSFMMDAPYSSPAGSTVRQSPISQWEDEGGALPTGPMIASCTTSCVNVGNAERIVSAVAGGVLLLHGLSCRSLSGWLPAIFGGCLLYRGVTGHCQVYDALGRVRRIRTEKHFFPQTKGDSQ